MSNAGAKTMSVAELFDKAQILPSTDREKLALMLLESLPEEENGPIEIDEEYEAELHRRLEMIRTGQAKGHTVESVMDSIRATLRGDQAE
jgi:putative addiction module component (TIGR02574 family)